MTDKSMKQIDEELTEAITQGFELIENKLDANDFKALLQSQLRLLADGVGDMDIEIDAASMLSAIFKIDELVDILENMQPEENDGGFADMINQLIEQGIIKRVDEDKEE